MKKKDLIPIVVIFAIFLAYPTIDRKFIVKFFPPKVAPVPAAIEKAVAPSLPTDLALAAPSAAAPAAVAAPADAEAPVEAEAEVLAEESAPAVFTTLVNDKVRITLSTHGAGIVEASMLGYPSVKGSEIPVTFDFSERTAGAPIGYPGLTAKSGFDLAAASDSSVIYRKVLSSGLVFERTLTLGDGYQIKIADRIENATAAAISLRDYGLQLGSMENLEGEADAQVPLLGVDTLKGSESVKNWSGDFDKWFPTDGSVGVVMVPGPGKPADPIDWAAVKNKYFVQILTPENAADHCRVQVTRGAPVSSTFMFLFPRTSYPIARVTADVRMPAYDLAPGQVLEQNATFFIGPKVYTELQANGPHQEDILQLGFWKIVGTWILKIMVWFHAHVWPFNYGVAIILLTFLIRIIFWPLNHKSMVSTRHMQEIQPLVTALKEKYKGDAQKQQQEMMALYKEHKINPMGGCLPMLVQIPVFFALFVVLRGAIELRFSSFLWISDLSTPENLFVDVLPFGLNILPLFMGVTMWLQQRMTPSSDPQQQKMMMMMPVIFTFMFYSFPSGLSLYWSINQVMMIVQLAIMKKRPPRSVLVKS